MMETENVLAFLLAGNQLKRTARTGWVQRGVAQAENVARFNGNPGGTPI